MHFVKRFDYDCVIFILMYKLPERLKDLRAEKGLSQRDLAKAANLSQGAIYLWENDQRVPNAKAVIALAVFFNVSSDYLLGLEN